MDDFRLWEMLSDKYVDGTEVDPYMRIVGGYYRTRSIRSGNKLEVEAYPMLPVSERKKIRKVKHSSDAMRAANERNAKKHFTRIVHANFKETDYFFTVTFSDDHGALPSLCLVEKAWKNYIKRVNYHRKKNGLENVKYVAVIEGMEEGTRKKRLHVHTIIEGGLDRETMEKLWTSGIIKVCRRLVPEAIDQLCQYLTKAPVTKKRWKYSKGNLKQPIIRFADKKITANKAQYVAVNVAGRAEALERLYPGYEVESVEVKTNPFVSGYYIYATMRKKAKALNCSPTRGGPGRVPYAWYTS